MNTTRNISGSKMEYSQASRKRDGKPSRSLGKMLGDVFVNSGVRPAAIRRIIVSIIFWGVLITLMWRRNPAGWVDHTQAIFVSLLIKRSLTGLILDSLRFLAFAISVVLSPAVLKPLLVLLGPFLLARQMVSIYLQDIFELDHTRVAREYIMHASLGSDYERLTIGAGTIDPKYLESPLLQIGGPGRVQVELDSAALFEKVDGACRVIGPTVGKSRYIFIEGFERLRDVIDLRDLQTSPMTTLSRSRDGIPVYAKDVRMVYSVERGSQKPTMEKPYPFSEEAVRQLVYRQLSFVTRGQPRVVSLDDYRKQTSRRWSGTMPVLISSALGDFVSEHDLSEFLANIGSLEVETLKQMDADIQMTDSTAAAGQNEEGRQPGKIPPAEFTSRSKLTSLFYDFAYGFSKKAGNRGVQLEWVGVGTWGTPASADFVNKNHLEAWRISRENFLRGHARTLDRLREDARLQNLQMLVNKVILEAYRAGRSENLPSERIVHKLLIAYRQQLLAAYDLYESEKMVNPAAPGIPFKLAEALKILNSFLGHRIN